MAGPFVMRSIAVDLQFLTIDLMTIAVAAPLGAYADN
jgi:hypothetical protein